MSEVLVQVFECIFVYLLSKVKDSVLFLYHYAITLNKIYYLNLARTQLRWLNLSELLIVM